MKTRKQSGMIRMAVIGGIIVALILVFGTLWTGRSAGRDTEKAVHTVSLLYLDELAGRREQVVADNLSDNIHVISIAIELMTPDDLSDAEHLQAYQLRMRRLFNLEKFAFVDENGLIYTATGTQTDIDEYRFDYRTISAPEISIKNVESPDKHVVIAVPVADIPFEGHRFVACFMEIDMEVMLQGVSMQSQDSDTTFCNIYTRDGVALSNTILGGLAVEDNLLEAMAKADYEPGYSLEQIRGDFAQGRKGVVSFTYNGVRETLSYVPVEGTDWLLTYLMRESVIRDQISTVSDGIIRRSLVQSALTALVLLALFSVIIAQTRRSARITLEKETAEAENRVKHQEMEQRLQLQERLLAQERQKAEQDKLITALAADYWSVYYIELDKNEGVCYQSHADLDTGFAAGQHFPYLESVTAYAEKYVTEAYREAFLCFVQPDAIRAALADARFISYRYMVRRGGRDSYEMVRFAGVRRPEDRADHMVHTVGGCFIDVDAETRRTLERNDALNMALAAAEEANRAKTVFLSNMSHEIRTPMNAIIGLDNITLSDPETPEKTRGYLEKINSSAQHLLNLINDILDMSRIESGRMVLKNEEFSFSKLLEAINTMFSSQCQDKGLDYRCHILGHVDEYYIGDNMKLRQVLINILGNAVKFTPKGGSVRLSVEPAARYDGKTLLRFVIADTGIGISEAYLPHIFEPFSQEDMSYSNRYGSSGLGLAITKNIVEMMNGTIQVDSEKGSGTTFTVAVTLLDADKDASGIESAEIHPGEMSVLVIDDDPIAREHAKLVLEKAGIAADLAASGPEALEMVRLRHARRSPYNLILVDWQMPEMDGLEATRRIRAMDREDAKTIPIIALTANAFDEDVQRSLQAGLNAHLSKPVDPDNLFETLESLIR